MKPLIALLVALIFIFGVVDFGFSEELKELKVLKVKKQKARSQRLKETK